MFVLSKRDFGFGLMGMFGTTTAAAAGETGGQSHAGSVELTFLKANDGENDSLARFIRQNWFAMDQIAVERGLMVDYRLLVSTGNEPDWDMVVVVGYPNQDGYAGIAKEFEAIRAAHTTVPINGKTLRQLGSIVSSRRLVPG